MTGLLRQDHIVDDTGVRGDVGRRNLCAVLRGKFVTQGRRVVGLRQSAAMQEPDSAARVVERSKGNSEMNPTRDLTLFGAFVYAQIGEAQKAIDLLGVYLQANERLRAAYADEPGWWFRDIAGQPAFKRLVGTQ